MTTISTTLWSLFEDLGIDDIDIKLNGNVYPAEARTFNHPGCGEEAEFISSEADGWQDKIDVKAMTELVAFINKLCRSKQYNKTIEKRLIRQAHIDKEIKDLFLCRS
jgi:hypothetical protein